MKSEILDKKIWQGLIGKNRKDQEVLYRLYYSYGMSICLRYNTNREGAKEILHDGFMVLFTDPKKFNPELPFKPWFRKVLVNLCINYYKKHQRQGHETGFEFIPESKDSQPSALDDMQYDELAQLIQRLPTAYRTVFNLYILDGYNHEEIAKMLGISIGTSKSNLSRAREKLRELLKPRTHAEEILR
ncbi:RNA polymerase sigma factor [Algoriphagus persicinus]|uniref:RNA polymerase sigma factor n=1 Tax=Algoriphagus persicinus TaxID=3108754 RepID=UPI002B3B3286|nr:sigma-70 family RNA polymerase sigma factor [Algoriphagus sp. E1-3-M2]MEB2783052.1 sigma-70 family RNA polymerase sigma factor [Algoriphagus sp. E1-3-M2]